MSHEPLKQLIYTSQCRTDPQSIVTPEFTEMIRARNAELAITGTLVWRDKRFMQILEGPATVINRMFGTILRDPKHHNLVLIFERIIYEREFPNWEMAIQPLLQQSEETISNPCRRRGARIIDAFRRGVW